MYTMDERNIMHETKVLKCENTKNSCIVLHYSGDFGTFLVSSEFQNVYLHQLYSYCFALHRRYLQELFIIYLFQHLSRSLPHSFLTWVATRSSSSAIHHWSRKHQIFRKKCWCSFQIPYFSLYSMPSQKKNTFFDLSPTKLINNIHSNLRVCSGNFSSVLKLFL